MFTKRLAKLSAKQLVNRLAKQYRQTVGKPYLRDIGPHSLWQRCSLWGLGVVPVPPLVLEALDDGEQGGEGGVLAEGHQVEPTGVGQPVQRVRVLRDRQRGAAPQEQGELKGQT